MNRIPVDYKESSYLQNKGQIITFTWKDLPKLICNIINTAGCTDSFSLYAHHRISNPGMSTFPVQK